MGAPSGQSVLVTGAKGFVGAALVRSLRKKGASVVATSRKPPPSDAEGEPGLTWRALDVSKPDTLPQALAGCRTAYYLVHSMGEGHDDFRELEREGARAFATAARFAGIERIVYLGGVAPRGEPSEHLKSRLEVGEILRSSEVPTLELRASMVIGCGGASWQIVRDLAMRLPFMIAPRWLRSRTRPVALTDVIAALLAAADVPLEGSAWFDLPGPEVMSGRQILERIAALRSRRIVMLEVPLLTPRLSSLWLRLVTRTDFGLARALVMGFEEDLLPASDRFWALIRHPALVAFDDAARMALKDELHSPDARDTLVRLEEGLVDLFGPRERHG